MIPVPQRIVSAEHGDCFKSCVASILELPYEEVPHFTDGEWLFDPGTGKPPRKIGWSEGINDWLLRGGWPLRYNTLHYHKHPQPEPKKGETLGYLDYFDLHEYPKHGHRGFWIASVVSANLPGRTHAVVMHESYVVFDPSPRQRRVPYVFVGEGWFEVTDIARVKPAPLEPFVPTPAPKKRKR